MKNYKVQRKSRKGLKLSWGVCEVCFIVIRHDLHSFFFFLGFDEQLSVFRAGRESDGIIVSLVIREEDNDEGATVKDLVKHSCGLFLLGMHLILPILERIICSILAREFDKDT